MAQIRNLPEPYSSKKVSDMADKIEKIHDEDIDTKTIAGQTDLLLDVEFIAGQEPENQRCARHINQ